MDGSRAVERVTRIELALSAWEADVLPLNYTRGRELLYPMVAGQRTAGPPTVVSGLLATSRQIS